MMSKLILLVAVLVGLVGCNSNPTQSVIGVQESDRYSIEYPDVTPDHIFKFPANEFCACLFYMETETGWAMMSGRADYEAGTYTPGGWNDNVRYRIVLWRCE
jgi:hypothetical protein